MFAKLYPSQVSQLTYYIYFEPSRKALNWGDEKDNYQVAKSWIGAMQKTPVGAVQHGIVAEITEMK